MESCMKDLFLNYNKVQGRFPAEVGVAFWDIVVISACDLAQEAWYLAQLQMKEEELPQGLPILCIADPPGPRIGSMGSTLHILTELVNR